MKKVVFFLVTVILVNFSQAQESIKKDELYIQTYAKIAVEEMELYKIPASITLAQGILETGNGQSTLAQVGNNHFGIKCKNEWIGDRMFHDDDAKGECFRKYPSAKDSYRDHSLFLAERPYYKKLFLLDPKDYKSWAYGLKQAGYATNPKYAYTLISLIERYQLDQFDNLSPDQVEKKLATLYPNSYIPIYQERKEEPKAIVASVEVKEQPKEKKSEVVFTKTISEVVTSNKTPKLEDKKIAKTKTSNFEFPSTRIRIHPNGSLRYVVFKDGDTLEEISKVYNISLENLQSYNELKFQDQLALNQKIFLEPKKKKGIQKEYIVKKEGEKMYEIAQNNAISIIELYKKNLMFPGQEPKKGDKILLRGQKS